ncbi:hypothetical protein [Floridanema aerugineum]|uniref:Uncharacterized protein n=1 Tax=Floridaenema aerugineum BLCC-F46 TaxID=3153654 RepID=A0ABV4WZN6_9CYAN
MNQELQNFIQDYVTLLQEKYNQSLIKTEKSQNEADAAFYQGASFTYYDALDILKSQLEAFGYEIESFNRIVPEFGKPKKL